MFWEKLTVDEFEKARETCGGVCVVPIGCLEKHGNQLPLGTDIIQARAIAERAAENCEVMIFPYLPFGSVCEVRHMLGTVALSSELLFRMLDELCEEISRNGFKKILLLNFHGGNAGFLANFIRTRCDKPHDYVVFSADAHYLTKAQNQRFLDFHGEPILYDGHAGVYETSTLMELTPELVHMDVLRPDGAPLGRMDEYRELNIQSTCGWYASYPNQMAGEPSKSTPEKGKLLVEMYVENVTKVFQKIKSDDTPLILMKEFYERSAKPGV